MPCPEGIIFYVGDGGDHDDLDAEEDVSRANILLSIVNFLESDARKLSRARKFRFPWSYEILLTYK